MRLSPDGRQTKKRKCCCIAHLLSRSHHLLQRMITSIIRTNGNSMPPKKGTLSRNKLAEFCKAIFCQLLFPKNMSPTICQIFGRFFHTSMTCTEIFARNFIHVLHSVISNAICAHFTISIHALVFVHNHRQYIFCNFNSLRIYVN